MQREQASHDLVIRREHPERLPRLSGVRRDDDRSKGLESEAGMDRGWLRQHSLAIRTYRDSGAVAAGSDTTL